jgi:hypothetical protein
VSVCARDVHVCVCVNANDASACAGVHASVRVAGGTTAAATRRRGQRPPTFLGRTPPWRPLSHDAVTSPKPPSLAPRPSPGRRPGILPAAHAGARPAAARHRGSDARAPLAARRPRRPGRGRGGGAPRARRARAGGGGAGAAAAVLVAVGPPIGPSAPALPRSHRRPHTLSLERIAPTRPKPTRQALSLFTPPPFLGIPNRLACPALERTSGVHRAARTRPSPWGPLPRGGRRSSPAPQKRRHALRKRPRHQGQRPACDGAALHKRKPAA